MPEETMQRLHAAVHGRVQGVNFRSYTAHKAAELELTGWVRNVHDGTVETVAEGKRKKLEEFLVVLRAGPPSAIVTQVEADWQAATGEFDKFNVHYDSW